MDDRALIFSDTRAPRKTGAVPAQGSGSRGGSGDDPDNNPHQGRRVFWRSFMASDRSTRGILAELVRNLRRAGLGAEDLSNAELVLAEVLNNIAEHAYEDGSGPVELRVELASDGLFCVIGDRGRTLPEGVVPDPALPHIEPPDHLPEGGFGWHIIRCLTTELAYRKDGDWNRLSMLVPWAD